MLLGKEQKRKHNALFSLSCRHPLAATDWSQNAVLDGLLVWPSMVVLLFSYAHSWARKSNQWSVAYCSSWLCSPIREILAWFICFLQIDPVPLFLLIPLILSTVMDLARKELALQGITELRFSSLLVSTTNWPDGCNIWKCYRIISF